MKKQKPHIKLHHITGWYGSIAIVSGYFLSSFGVFDGDSVLYQLINLTGASGLFYLALHKHIKESMFLNSFWIIIALVSLIRLAI